MQSLDRSPNRERFRTPTTDRRPRWLRVAGWLWVGVGAFYALFALTAAAAAVAELAGPADQVPTRAAPPFFIAHAVAGGLALLAVSLQMALAAPPPPSRRRLHRTLGTAYVVTAAVTSLLSLPVVAAFDVSPLAKAAFLGEAALWLLTTVVAFVHIRARRVARHREWMIRSFALAAFFVTFSLWDPVMAALPLSPDTGFAVAVLLGWTLNLAAAQVWIRATRGR
jgi:hypothetical protein